MSDGTPNAENSFEARGGISLLSTFTGVLVALGTLFLLSAIVAGVIEAVDELESSSTTVEIGVGAGIAFIVAQFIAYLWGGYTAARMGRGAGLAHGFLVPLFALLLAAIVAGIATALGAAANLGLPFTETRLPVERDYLIDWGAGVGIGSLVAMFVGGIIGGIRGARWHSRLEAEKREESADPTAIISEETVKEGEETAPVAPVQRPPDRDLERPVPPTAIPPAADPSDQTSPDHRSDVPPVP